MEVHSTKDYSIFKKHPSNRDISEKIVKNKMRSIKESNLLYLYPFLLDREFRVIDGQHRLEAAKRLGLEVYYQISEEVSSKDICTLNSSQSRWTIGDYMNFYAEEGNVNYLKLRNFSQKLKIRNTLAMTILRIAKGGSGLRSFKEGRLSFPNKEEEILALENLGNLQHFIEYIHPKLSGHKEYLSGPTFAKAFCIFMNVKSVNFETFMKRLPYKLDLIRPCSGATQYLEIFKEIYNFRNTNPLTSQDLQDV